MAAWLFLENFGFLISHIVDKYLVDVLTDIFCMQALVAPASLIAQNAGIEGEVVVEKIKDGEWEIGYNAMADRYENLVEAGVIDPAKVTRCALQNAASVAGMVLTTQAIVVEKPKTKAPAAAPQQGLAI